MKPNLETPPKGHVAKHAPVTEDHLRNNIEHPTSSKDLKKPRVFLVFWVTQPLNAQFARGSSDRRYCWAPMASIWTQIEEIGSSSSFLWVLVPQIMQSFFYLINASELEPSQLILIFLSSLPTILEVPESLWQARTKRVNPKGGHKENTHVKPQSIVKPNHNDNFQEM